MPITGAVTIKASETSFGVSFGGLHWVPASNTTLEPAYNSYSLNKTSVDSWSEEFHVDNYVWIYTAPILFLIGLLGNVLALYIIGREPKFRRTASGVYLILILSCDLFKLWVGLLPEWLDQMDIVVTKHLHIWVCRSEKFLSYTTSNISIWTLCAFSLDRCYAVACPLLRRRRVQLSTMTSALKISTVILICALGFSLNVFWTRDHVYNDSGQLLIVCGRPERFYHFERKIRPWIVFVFVDLIPLIIICCTNAIIVKCLWFAQQKGNALTAVIQLQKKGGALSASLYICLASSALFVLCITPTMVLYIGAAYWNTEGNETYKVTKAVCNQMVYLTHCFNIFLYCLTGTEFRKKLKECLSGCCGKQCLMKPHTAVVYSIKTKWENSIHCGRFTMVKVV